MTKKLKIPLFDKDQLLKDLKKTPTERLKEACALYDRFEALTPYPFKPVVKSFSSFKEYEKWKKQQKDPRYW